MAAMEEPKKRFPYRSLASIAMLVISVFAVGLIATAGRHGTIIGLLERLQIFAPHSEAATARITQVQVGFPAGAVCGKHADGAGRYFKPGAWAPVMVDVTAGPHGLYQLSMSGPPVPTYAYQLVTATSDNDNILSFYPFDLPNLGPNEHARVLTYMRPCATHGDLTVSVRGEFAYDPKSATPDLTTFQHSAKSLDLGDQLILTAGLALPGLQRALDRSNELNTAKYRVAHINSAEPLPAEWYGYDAIDLLVVGTSEPSFVQRLIDQRKQSQALADWVRRGGRLLISTGRNPDVARRLIEKLGLRLPVEIAARTSVRRLDAVETWLRERRPPPLSDVSRGVVIARLKPGRLSETIIAQNNGQAILPIVLRVPCGLGQVTLTAFDLDQAPFNDWSAEGEFWYKLLDVPRPAVATAASPRREAPEQDATDLASMLQHGLEAFADVQGTASHFERDEVRINKVDLVDLDFHSQQMFGSTWFSLLSSRRNDFKIGLDLALPVVGYVQHPAPADKALAKDLGVVPGLDVVSPGWVIGVKGDDWVSQLTGTKNGGGLLSWLARPETGFGGYGRACVQGPVHDSYEYLQSGYEAAGQVAGLERVPIAALRAKSFSGRWVHPLSRKHPLATTDIHRQGDGPIVGTITSRLPADLQDAYLIVGGDPTRHTVFRLGTLVREQPKRLSLKVGEKGSRVAEWLVASATAHSGGKETELPLDMLMRRLMFYGEGSQQDHVLDAPLRYLDQSWRLPLKGEAILVARLAPVEGSEEQVRFCAASAIRLSVFCGEYALKRTIRQDTFVRMFLPVRQEDAGASTSSPRKK